MGGRHAPRRVEAGAGSIVSAATEAGAETGGFYRDGKPATW
jgi:hypothetical protein